MIGSFARSAVAIALLVAGGCASLGSAPSATEIGTFHVTAKRTSDSCGDASPTLPATVEFDVRFLREADTIYWDNGQDMVGGTLTDDHKFSFDTTLTLDMRAQDGSAAGLPPCSIARRDRADGTLSDASDAFTGTLTYDFTPTQGSDCSDLLQGATAQFSTLPCSATYDTTAKRTVAPGQ